MDNVRGAYVDVAFSENARCITARSIYQYDHGLKQRIHGITSSTLPLVQFSYSGLERAVSSLPTQEDQTLVSDIPDVVLMQPNEVRGYVYVEDDTAGRTVYEIRFPIIPRSQPADISLTPQQNDAYSRLVSQLNELISETTKQNEQSTEAAKEANEALERATGMEEAIQSATNAANTAAEAAATQAERLEKLRFYFNSDYELCVTL